MIFSTWRSRPTSWLDAGVILSLGLFPVLHLLSLKIAILLILVGVLAQGRSAFKNLPAIRWHHLALLQFAIFFFINALLFAPLPGTPLHLRPIAMESSAMTAIGVILVWLYLKDGRSLEATWRIYLPVGLLLSFAIMTFYFLFVWDGGGEKVSALAPNGHIPPMWFLTFTLISFIRFSELSRSEKILRFILFGLSAIMIMYAGARLALIAWSLCALVLGIYLIRLQPAPQRRTLTLAGIGGLMVFLSAIYILDRATAGILDERIRETIHGLSNESTTFFRLELWRAALAIISESLPWGRGQINERALMNIALERDISLRAHQTYLSYLIAGGYLALLSGIVFQAAGLRLLQAEKVQGLFPAFLGLVCVPTLNCFTDSLFQSYVTVQLYVLLTLILCNDVKPQRDK